jgi:hypothetical protein
MFTKRERNTLFNIIETAGLDPTQCEWEDLAEDLIRIIHRTSGSFYQIRENEPDINYELIIQVGDEPNAATLGHRRSAIEPTVRAWANDVKEFIHTPDLWTEVRRAKEVLSGEVYEAMGNAPFTSDEQLRIAGRLEEIRQYVKDKYSLPGEQLSQIEAKLDEIEEASHRLGRKDWLNIFYGVMFTLIVTALVPPDVVQHIIVMGIHGLGDLFGFGGPPPALPPVA